MALTQPPVTEAALAQGLPTDAPEWKQLPSWFVFGDQDRNISGKRCGSLPSARSRSAAGASHFDKHERSRR
jgi:hypothetical protein